MGAFVVGGGLGDWDPDEKERGEGWARIIAVGGFYVLDFSLNGLQASLRVSFSCSADGRITFVREAVRMRH